MPQKFQLMIPLVVAFLALSSHAEETLEKKQIVIEPWQFCAGCKATVASYMHVSMSAVMQLREEGKSDDEITLNPNFSEFCRSDYFQGYKEFVYHSCRFLGRNYRSQFIEVFSHENFDEAYRNSKGNVYNKVEEVWNLRMSDDSHFCLEDLFQGDWGLQKLPPI
jgi:hypothetical protein